MKPNVLPIASRKSIALVAHDNKNHDLALDVREL